MINRPEWRSPVFFIGKEGEDMLNNTQIRYCLDEMGKLFPDAHCELNHSNPFELVVAVVLSAQCTDALVNKVTKNLFQKYKKPEDFMAVSLSELENDIRSIGLYRNKAKNIQKLSQIILEKYNGIVPNDRDLLTELPGVGRKTANVVVSVAYGVPAIAVDTHVERVSKRLGICRWKDSVLEVEKTLMRRIPEDEWSITHHRMIFFGRYHCKAQSPKCEVCPMLLLCREGKKRMKAAGKK